MPDEWVNEEAMTVRYSSCQRGAVEPRYSYESKKNQCTNERPIATKRKESIPISKKCKLICSHNLYTLASACKLFWLHLVLADIPFSWHAYSKSFSLFQICELNYNINYSLLVKKWTKYWKKHPHRCDHLKWTTSSG